MDYWKVADSNYGIVITCRGHDKEGTVQRAVAAFDTIASSREGAFSIVADLREMTGYETESRKAWQTCFAQYRARVRGLVLIGARSALIKMGAAAVGAYAGIPVKFVATWSDVAKTAPATER